VIRVEIGELLGNGEVLQRVNLFVFFLKFDFDSIEGFLVDFGKPVEESVRIDARELSNEIFGVVLFGKAVFGVFGIDFM